MCGLLTSFGFVNLVLIGIAIYKPRSVYAGYINCLAQLNDCADGEKLCQAGRAENRMLDDDRFRRSFKIESVC